MSAEQRLTLPIQTKRLILRDVTIEDFDDVYVYASDPEVTRHMFHGPRDAAETRDYIERIITTQKQCPRQVWQLAAVERATGQVVGMCDLTMENEREADLGYIFCQQVWGQGLATEAARALVEAGFVQLGLERIYAVCEVGHTRSGQVLEKSGLRYNGVLERYYESKGRWWNMNLYELFRHEWEATRQALPA